MADGKSISDILRREREILLRYNKKLKSSNEKLNLILGLTRHDVYNNIITVNGFADLAKGATDEESQEYFKYIKEALSAAQNALVFSKEYQEVGMEKPLWRDMNDSIKNGLSDINLEGEGITLEYDFEGLNVYADSLIEKVFYNLADNTIRHGGKEVTKIDIYYEEFEKGLKLIYEDNGKGVQKSKKETIFERGYGDNTGYGLYLIKEILEINGMDIKETGEPEKGAKFEIAIPEDKYKISKNII